MVRAKLDEQAFEDDIPEDEHSDGQDNQDIMWPSAKNKDVKSSGGAEMEEIPIRNEENKKGNVQNSIVIESKWRDQEIVKQQQ